MDVLQLFVSGLANGCVYGLIALGFVLIYKATEAVNFAQGDFMMLGAFITLGLTNDQFWGLPFWISVPIAITCMGAFGYLLDMLVLRRMFGQSQVAVVILTIALGFVLRFAAGVIWGHQPVSLESPIAGKDVRFGGIVLGLDEVTIIIVTVILTVLLYFYFNRTKLGVAIQEYWTPMAATAEPTAPSHAVWPRVADGGVMLNFRLDDAGAIIEGSRL